LCCSDEETWLRGREVMAGYWNLGEEEEVPRALSGMRKRVVTGNVVEEPCETVMEIGLDEI
jgi:hypothetical protein